MPDPYEVSRKLQEETVVKSLMLWVSVSTISHPSVWDLRELVSFLFPCLFLGEIIKDLHLRLFVWGRVT